MNDYFIWFSIDLRHTVYETFDFRKPAGAEMSLSLQMYANFVVDECLNLICWALDAIFECQFAKRTLLSPVVDLNETIKVDFNSVEDNKHTDAGVVSRKKKFYVEKKQIVGSS